MADLKKRNLKQQQMNDARKARHDKSLSQKKLQAEEDDDDGSGGGPGKRKQSGFKLEKLLGAIAEERQKAKGFWKALAQEGLDISDIKKSELNKQKEKTAKASDTLEKPASGDIAEQEAKKEAKETVERATEERESRLDDKELSPEKTDKTEPAWEKAKAVDSAAKRQFGFDKSSAADAGNKAATGAFLQGSNGIRDGNYNGASVQVDLDGQLSGTTANSASVAQNSAGIWGQGTNASKQANHQGLGSHAANAMGIASHMFDAGRGTRADSGKGLSVKNDSAETQHVKASARKR